MGQFAILRRLVLPRIQACAMLGEMDEHRTPGQLIEALLTERGWSQRTLAIVLGKGETSMNKMVAGKQPVDAETAVMLEEVFGVGADRFLALQRDFDLALARLSVRPDPQRATRAFVFGGLPIAEMARRGWIAVGDTKNVGEVETAVSRFFGVNRLDDIEILPHAARKTETSTPVTPAQLAWLYRVKTMASEMLVPRYSPKHLNDVLAALRPLLLSPESARRVPRILMEAGIRFLVVETLPATKIDGVCFWLNDHSPVVALSLRHDRNDNFWFVLRHELEHVRLEHGKAAVIVDADLDGERAGTGDGVPEEERLANAAAADFCVPRSQIEAFIARKAPFFSERDMIGFARSLKVHPGIVAGQLQHKTERYERFRQHLAKVRSYVLPNALVDGWGDIAPVGQ
jgi:HTH-type transcriptional regulator/antitoxin HigA